MLTLVSHTDFQTPMTLCGTFRLLCLCDMISLEADSSYDRDKIGFEVNLSCEIEIEIRGWMSWGSARQKEDR